MMFVNGCAKRGNFVNEYKVVFARSARKELESLDITLVNRILLKIEALVKDPRPGQCRKIIGEKNLWRLRIGDYRVIYSIDDEQRMIDINAIRHRSDAYR